MAHLLKVSPLSQSDPQRPAPKSGKSDGNVDAHILAINAAINGNDEQHCATDVDNLSRNSRASTRRKTRRSQYRHPGMSNASNTLPQRERSFTNSWIPDLVPKPTLTAKKSRANQYAGINEEELEEIPAEESGILNETDQEWTQFDMMELEEAR